MNKIVLLIILFLFVSCATTTPGKNISTGSKNVTATVATNRDFSDERFQLYQVSFKNNSKEWIEFEGAKVTDNSSIEILVGNKLNSWIEACQLEKQVKDHNTYALLGTIAVAGAIVAVGSNHQNTAAAGAWVALGSISVSSVKELQGSIKEIEFQKAFPDTHLFRPFAIPPGKVIQRWILIENKKNEYLNLKLTSKQGDDLALKM
jgi:hypothetical protein